MPKFTYKNLLIFLLASSIFALSLAYISQYYFGLEPCELCFYQRKPFFAVIILSILGMIIKKPGWKKTMVIISILFILANAFLALYHVGVEKKIFQGLPSCLAASSFINNIEELKQYLANTKPVRCDKPAFIFMGISMAGWNVVYCLFLVAIAVIFLRKIKLSFK